MSARRRLIPLLVFAAVLGGVLAGASRSAEAGNYIVYLHGRSASGWPSNALLGQPAGWYHVPLSYAGSAPLTDNGVRSQIIETLASYCGAWNQCVVVCHSAGCARMLDAYKVLKDQGRYPPNILWSEAVASAAGGSELAVLVTKWGIRLLAKLYNFDAAIDYDIQPNVMRYGAHASIQNEATSPVYHLAGSKDICLSFRILFIKVKLCTNGRFPGDYGDGLVPVHSAGGYADTNAHASTNDGSAKYLFRAYEQTALYDADHFSILGPMVTAASLRLAVSKSLTCAGPPAINPAIPDASIIYDDGDGAYAEESSPLNTLAMCGNAVWSGGTPLYATCYSAAGCCSSFSTGDAGGCSCGEALCKQPQYAHISYYTGDNCTGTEYSQAYDPNAFVSYDGVGMAGQATAHVSVQSARASWNGRCMVLVHQNSWGGNCTETYPVNKTLPSARRVYRAAGAPPPPAGDGGEMVVSSTDFPRTHCPL